MRTRDGRNVSNWTKLGIFGAFAMLVGCGTLRRDDKPAENPVARFFPSGRKAQPEPGELQQSLLRFADSYSVRLIESVNELEKNDLGPFTAETALRFKIYSVGTVVTTATGENPNVNLLNMIGIATLSRLSLEHYWKETPNGELFEPWLKRARELEAKVWLIADQVLTQEQQDELMTTIEEHYSTVAGSDRLFLAHPEDLTMPKDLFVKRDEKSVFSLAAINPFAALDPTVREIAQTRLFAERAVYGMRWMPWLLRWQARLLTLETTHQPDVARTLEDLSMLSESVSRASLAAQSISQTAETLPDRLSSEREAILAALEEQEGRLTTLFEAGSEMSVSVTETIEALDLLMKRFGVGEPKPPRDPNREPFDILKYARTADAFTATAQELNAALSELNATLDSPALESLAKETTADLRALLNHAFQLSAGLILIVFSCAALYRRGTRRPDGS